MKGKKAKVRASAGTRREPRTRRTEAEARAARAAIHAAAHGWACAMLLTAGLGWPGGAGAMQPLVTEDAGTLGQAKHQLELGNAFTREEERAGGVKVREDGAATGLTFGAGVQEDLDVLVSGTALWTRARENGAEVSKEAGLGDAALDVKWRFFSRGDLSLALKPGVVFPSGEARRGLGDGRMGVRGVLVASHEFGPFSLHLNAGYARREFALAEDRAASRADLWSGSAAGVYQLTDAIQLAADVGATTNPERGASTWPVYGLLGLVQSVGDAVDLALGLKAGLTRPETDASLLLGLTWRP